MSDSLVFTLHPFASSAEAPDLQLQGHVARQDDHLHVVYQLSGNLASVVLPAPTTSAPLRRDGLWEHTCFELFLAAEGADPYWEVNLAPHGHWNLYRLDGYRRGLTPVMDRQAMPFSLSQRADALELALAFLLPEELQVACRECPLMLGVTAVIERQGGELSYWALAHGGSEADFHRRADFLLRP